MLDDILIRMRALLRRDAVENELEDELRFHFDREVEKFLQAGLTPTEARRRARLAVGGSEQIKEECREARGVHFLETLGQDIRYGLRMLRKSPGFTVVAILTLALGIGANTAIFTLLNAAILRLLPVPEAGRLVAVSQEVRRLNGPIHRNVHDDASFVSYSEYQAYARDNGVFRGLLAYSPFTELDLGGVHPQELIGTLTSCNYFEVLEVHPALGRGFADSECAAPGAGAVVVLGDELWRSTFGANPSIIGKPIMLNRVPLVVIGIAPAGFSGTLPVAAAVWAPLTMQNALEHHRDRLADDYMSWLAMIGRKKPGISDQEVAADLGVIASRFNRLQTGRITTVTIAPATLLATTSLRSLLLVIVGLMMGAVGMVLLLACANVANLLLARAAGRRKEIAVRLALGAKRGRLIRQLLTESLLLAFLGGAAGSLLSIWSSSALFQFAISHLPIAPVTFAISLAPDFHVFLYAFALSVITAGLFGIAPALRASRLDLTLAMKEEGAESQTTSHSRGLLRHALVGTQVAICMILLLVTGLLLRGLRRAQTVDPGFRMENIEAVSFNLRAAGYTPANAAAFQRELVDRVRSVAGVDAVAQAFALPLGSDFSSINFSTPGKSEDYDVEYNYVSPNFFPLLGIPILQGRNFSESEAQSGAHVVILTQSTARRFWPGGNPIGKQLRGDSGDWEVIGVAKDVQVATLAESGTMYLYHPAGPDSQLALHLMVHSTGDGGATANAIRAAAKEIDPDLLVTVAPLASNLEFWRKPSRVVSMLAGMLGGLALLLASVGISGMVAYVVSRRVREIGIRMALGAESRDVMGMILRQAMLPVAAGALIGTGLCACVSWIFSRLLFGVSPWDPVAFVCMPTLLMLVALVASYIPARRAMRVDPMVALRYE